MAYGWKVIAVQDAYTALPYADVMYGCNPSWWRLHKDCAGFHGEKWTSHQGGKDSTNNKLDPDYELKVPIADAFGLNVVEGRHGDVFSLDPSYISYGSNSGFQAINLAILFGCRRIVLVGFDMRHVGGKSHFFGDHPGGEVRQNSDGDYRNFVRHFAVGARELPKEIVVINATPGSALDCWPIMGFDEATSAVYSSPPCQP